MANRYYRITVIPYEFIDKWLNLPKGFEIESSRDSLEEGGLMLKIKCPENEKFRIEVGEMPPRIAEIRYSTKKIEWPELEF